MTIQDLLQALQNRDAVSLAQGSVGFNRPNRVQVQPTQIGFDNYFTGESMGTLPVMQRAAANNFSSMNNRLHAGLNEDSVPLAPIQNPVNSRMVQRASGPQLQQSLANPNWQTPRNFNRSQQTPGFTTLNSGAVQSPHSEFMRRRIGF